MKHPARVLTRAAAAMTLLVLAGCGQKGPLYLPEKGGTVVTAPAASAPAAGPETPAPYGQPPEPAPAPQPQSAPEPPPSGTTAPPAKKDTTDEEQNPK